MSLSTILQSIQKGTLKNILTGAGLALTTSSISYVAFQQAVNAVQQKAYGIPGDLIAILHLAGFDIFFSTVLAAIVTRLSLNAGNLALKKI